MSFPRAQVKRFNEQSGCAPPPGYYSMSEVKKKGAGVLPFETGGQRFKDESNNTEKDVNNVADQLSTATINANGQSFSKKQLDFAVPSTVPVKSKPNSNKTTPHPSPSINNKDKQRYEKEIRSLIQQINDQERKLQLKIQENAKLNGKICLLSKDKSSLLAHVATAEKRAADLERKNCVLQSQKSIENEKQNKREHIEEDLKKTKQKYETAKLELDKCRSLLVALQSDLESSRSTISALKQSNNVLTQLNKEVQEHSDDVSSQVSKLQGLADILRSEKLAVEERFVTTNERLQNVEKNFTESLQQKANEIEQRLNDKQKSIYESLEKAENEITELKQIEENSRTLISALESEKNCLTQEKDKLKRNISRLEKENERSSHTISNLENSSKSLQQNFEFMKKEAAVLNEKISDLENEISRLKDDHSKEIEKLRLQVNKQCIENEQLTSQNEEFQKTLKSVEQERDDLFKQIQDNLKSGEVENQKLIDAEEKCDRAQEKLLAITNELKELTELRFKEKLESDELFNKCKDVEAENAAMMKKHAQSQQEISEFKEQINLLEAKADHLETLLMKANQKSAKVQENEEFTNQKVEQLEQSLKDKESQYQAKLAEFTRRLLETQKKLNHKQEELQEIVSTKESNIAEMKQMRKTMEENSNRLQDVDRLEKENIVLLDKVDKLQNNLSAAQQEASSTEDIEKWKKLYEDLKEKVEPFKFQIDAYSAEKSALLSENSAAHAEMQALGKKYAELLGHQNQKQKIRHVVKIKEENLGLKQEVSKLRTQVSKLQKQVLAHRPPKFDPSEAFQHKKENTTPFGQKN